MDDFNDREFFVLYRPFENIRDESFLRKFSVDGRLDVNVVLEEEEVPKFAKNVQYVLSMKELARYIFFREKLVDIKDAAGRCFDAG